MSECNKCKQPIEWLMTTKGKNMPIDPTPIPVTVDGNRVVKAYRSHFSTCPAMQQQDNSNFSQNQSPPPQKDDDLPW